jgi:hypothetical protein
VKWTPCREISHSAIHWHNCWIDSLVKDQRILHGFTHLRIRDPHGLLGIIDLGLVSPLHLDGGEKELRGVGVHRTLRQLDVAWHGDSWLLEPFQFAPKTNMYVNIK